MGSALYTGRRNDIAYHHTDFAVARHPLIYRGIGHSHIMVVCGMVYRPDAAVSLSDDRTGIVRCIAWHQSVDDAVSDGCRRRNRGVFVENVSLASITWIGALGVMIAIVVSLMTFSSHLKEKASHLEEINQ